MANCFVNIDRDTPLLLPPDLPKKTPGSLFGGWFGCGTTKPVPFVSIRVHSWLN
jgi:hypothetical protein